MTKQNKKLTSLKKIIINKSVIRHRSQQISFIFRSLANFYDLGLPYYFVLIFI